MKIEKALALILAELERAEEIHPKWPVSLVHQTAIIAEEAGETLQAALNHEDRNGERKAIIIEAVHTAASALRFLKNMGDCDE